MPLCPLHQSKAVEGPCPDTSCYLNVPTLDFRCLQLHSTIYDKSTTDILGSLYGKAYRMTVALSIKATRISYVLRELKPMPNRPITWDIEKNWVEDIKAAGNLNPNLHWTEITEENTKYLFRDRMLQVLNTMEAYEFSLREALFSYHSMFNKIDLQSFAIRDTDEKAINKLFRRK